MSIRLTNDVVKVEGMWRTWKAYLVSDDPEELKNVKEVEYVLHPSFKKSIVTVKESKNNFELIETGWGPFNLKATVYYVDGTSPLSFEHWLDFGHSDNGGDAVRPRKKSFLERIFSRK